ncbi:hypothetical protein HYC85_011541 [Camellia sinensis]|uniref:4-hydroxyphenylpyruvate dioxygenase n=1 Tax=Camellia sinensis TaxID=4442 RepID=A0A7J7HCG6_CAMSI|nr:hypothetical protein HYC85_011541 [Camellia sinensis]
MGKDAETVSNGGDAQVSNSTQGFKLVGFSNFVRTNPKTDRFAVKRFHHVEFWCTDATNVARRFSWGLGMPIVAKSDLSTGNLSHASYLLRSGHLCFLFTAPYSPSIAAAENLTSAAIPTFNSSACRSFSAAHGLAVRSIAIEVEDAELAFSASVAHGAKPSSPPINLDDRAVIAEVQLYGDVVLRYISYKNPNPPENTSHPDSWFLPGFESMDEGSVFPVDFGIRRLDHAVGNVPELAPMIEYVKGFTGFHEFAEFTAEDVGTSESGLNSMVLASNNEMVLLPMNEPVFGTKRKSQIQTYLEHNEGAGLQHLALDFEGDEAAKWGRWVRVYAIAAAYLLPEFEKRVGDVLSDEQIKEAEELGILVDRDDQGTLLQIFTKPVGDRPTIFIEIIQRVGCMLKDDEGKVYQKGGCGGFGKGNFSELFKSIEEYEKTLEAKRISAEPATA